MNKQHYFILIGFGMLLIPLTSYCQELPDEIDVEQSAEVFLEAYSDEFQENFFEALKQKGIENYDKAINLLLKCKQLDANNRVVDHELAKAYYEDKKFTIAETYAKEALNAEPENLWYLETLVDILEKEHSEIDAITQKISLSNSKLKENLALIYFKKGAFEASLNVLKDAKKTPFSIDLEQKINDVKAKKNTKNKSATLKKDNITIEEINPTQGYQIQLKLLIESANTVEILKIAEEAIEAYPTQPFFYYAQGFALNKNGKPKEAISILEAGLDFLVNDKALANKFYTELATAHTTTNNTSKANMYLSKIKPGF